VTTPPSRPPQSWNGEGEVLGVVPLLRADGSEEESQFVLVVPEDVRPSEAKTMILPSTPDESLVVDVARSLDSGSMIEQAHRILMQVPYVSAIIGYISFIGIRTLFDEKGGRQCGGRCMVVCACDT